MPYPRAKSAKVGEVGWGVVKLMDYSLLKSGHQIMVQNSIIIIYLHLYHLAHNDMFYIIIVRVIVYISQVTVVVGCM